MYRLKLLQYLDRLSTYEDILGGVHIAHEEYCHTFFERFRELNILQAAVEYARVCYINAEENVPEHYYLLLI